MILQSLVALYDRLSEDATYKIPPFGHSVQKITFKIVLRPDGTLFDIQDTRQNEAGKLRPQRVLVPGQAKSSGSGINPGFLWDNKAYLLGYDADPKKRARALRAFEGFQRTVNQREHAESMQGQRLLEPFVQARLVELVQLSPHAFRSRFASS